MKKVFALVATASLMFSCTQEEVTPNFEKNPINISMGMEKQSRANDVTYENGDEIGLYVVNYDGSTTGTLKDQENQVDNMRFTYNSGTWNPDESIFWKDKNTAADFYAYYPYNESVNISAHPFSVNADQSTEENFWASDFLWGKTSNVLPTPLAVPIKTKHSFSRILVEIKAGKGFTDETWTNATKSIKIYSVQTSATIDLSTGVATATGNKEEIIPLKTSENNYQAMIVPQVVEDASRLVVATVDGTDYVYRNGYEFKANTQHKFTITVNKTDGSVNITIGEWDTDEADNNGEATEEIIPNNQVWYTSTDGAIIEPSTDGFGANIESNTYENGKGVITFDGDVTSLGSFYGRESLASVTIPYSVSSFPDNVHLFGACPNLMEFKGKFASADGRCLIVNGRLIEFAPYGITSYEIPDGVTSIGGVFYTCENLASVTIPNSVTTLEEHSFYCMGLKEFKGKFATEDGLCLIADDMVVRFAVASEVTSYTIPNNITKIGECAFDGASRLEEVNIPNSVAHIGYYAFRSCNFTNITIPESVTYIGHQAFNWTHNLANVYCKPSTPPQGSDSMFSGYNHETSAKIYVPIGSSEAYKTSDYWKDYAEIIEELEM